jgi:hypothetical protein
MPFDHQTCRGGDEQTMRAIRLGIIALTCSWPLLAAVSSFARTNSGAAAAFTNPTAQTPYGNLPTLWVRDLSFSPHQARLNFDEQAKLASSDVPALWVRAMAFSPDQNQGNSQQQTKPPSNNEPSLQGLGFPTNETQGSAREQALLDKRSHMLQIHQKLGLLTTIPLVITIFTGPGAKGHHGLPGSPTGRDLHAGLGILTTAMYFTSAYYAIRAPKIPDSKSYGLIRLHKALAWIHGPGMIITPILGSIAFSQLSRGERVHGIAKYHAWAAYTTAAAYGAAILSVTIK